MTGRDVRRQRPVEGRPSEDAELTERARDGDVGAFEELVTRYQGIAFRVAWLVVHDRGEAEDAVQEAFVKAYYALPRFRPGAPFRPWVLRIVANEARNRGGPRAVGKRSPCGRPRSHRRTRPRPPRPRRSRARTPRRCVARDRPASRADRLVVAYRFLLEMSRGRDRRSARRAARHGEVEALAGAGAAPHASWRRQSDLAEGTSRERPLRAMTDDAARRAALAELGDRVDWPGRPTSRRRSATTIRESEAAPSLVAPRLSCRAGGARVLMLAAALARARGGRRWPRGS